MADDTEEKRGFLVLLGCMVGKTVSERILYQNLLNT